MAHGQLSGPILPILCPTYLNHPLYLQSYVFQKAHLYFDTECLIVQLKHNLTNRDDQGISGISTQINYHKLDVSHYKSITSVCIVRNVLIKYMNCNVDLV